MNNLKIAVIILLSVFGFVIFIFAILGRKPLRTILLNAFIGLTALAIINLTAKFSGVFIPINAYSVIGSSAFGLPAIILFLFAGILFL